MSRSKGTGWYDFAGFMMAIVGISYSISGLHALLKKEYFSEESLLFGSLQLWAWVWLIVGMLGLVAASALIGGGGRMLGIVLASLSAVVTLLTFDTAGQHSLARLLLAVLVIYGLTTHGEEGTGGMLTPSAAPDQRTAPMPPR